jgi:hypothetical protein
MDSNEPVVNQYGDTIATLTWRDNRNGDGTEYARIDNGTITRADRTGPVTVQCQDTTTGRVTRYTMPDTVTAFYALGLSAHRCNGIDGWLALSLLPGTAGRD